jgi:hypothetical protein
MPSLFYFFLRGQLKADVTPLLLLVTVDSSGTVLIHLTPRTLESAMRALFSCHYFTSPQPC